ncbi:hypothetical protein CPB84DRAFT_1821371 [Gymnopilus junonius]|uniref:Uncharacterized protein n=1 Tax=Gymnopilus junonius TaxID=109634 RepID=A0A9P5TT37_GYMJU|nr:hypothetical protein CPB84DRAFT_1821371 [Gymnopilus junonius]
MTGMPDSRLPAHLLIAIFIIATSYLAAKPLDFTAPNASPIDAQIILTAELVAVDAARRTLDMNWYPGLSSGCAPDTHFVADIYFDPNLLDSSSPSFTSLPPFSPAYRLNSSQFCGSTSPVALLATFRAVTKLLASDLNPQISMKSSTLQDYPFDIYNAKFSIYALDHDTVGVIHLNVTKSYGIAVIPFKTTIANVSSNFEVTPTRTVVLGNVMPYLSIDLQVSRSKAIKGLAILVAISNWLLLVAILVISAATLIHPNTRYSGEMLVLLILTLFVFTSIRKILPGAPEVFGSRIDLYTILPILMAVALSGFLFLLTPFGDAYSREKMGRVIQGPSLFDPVKDTVHGFPTTSKIQVVKMDSELGNFETIPKASVGAESRSDNGGRVDYTTG